MDSLTVTTATRLREAIAASGRSLVDISEATGIPRTTLLRRLTGRSPFTVEELGALATELGTTAHALIGPEDVPA
jgi:transcriptional regulator with XRE-family HTH domain